MKLTFLSSSVPLTKSYTKLADGSIEKSSYPNVWQVSTHFENAKTMQGMAALLTAHGSQGHCLLKGNALRALSDESRKGVTDTNATTEYLCLDFDGIQASFVRTVSVQNPVTGQQEEKQVKTNIIPDVLMEALGMKDVSYILQWSGSQGIGGTDLRCHIFVHLSKIAAAPLIKQWLIQKNHEVDVLKAHQGLTKTGNSLTWGLDITACQSDKLIYIAPPVLKGIKNPLGKQPRISFVKKTHDSFDITAGKINTTDQNRQLTDARILELRDAAGLPKRKLQYKVSGAHQVLVKPDECIVTEMKAERGFVYFNLNGGDSWAYYHPEDNPDYIFNFKGEPAYLTKELLPSYWEQLQTQAYRTSTSGLTYLAFLDRNTSTYWRGTYDATNDELNVYPAKTESMVRQFADSNGLRLGNNIPEWDMEFNPHDDIRVDFPNAVINTFQRSEYMKTPPNTKVKTCPPITMRVISHVLAGDVDAIEHFMNWLAFIVQFRDRTRTAWIFQGTQGCLAGDVELQFRRGKRNGGRPTTVKQAYEFWTGANKGRNGKGWDLNLPTYAKSVKDNMTVGYHEVYKIVESGVKQLFTLTTESGKSIRITELHPFMRPDGSFTPLNELKVGDMVVMEGSPLEHVADPQGRNKARHTTYSIPHHLFAWRHMIAGKNYQRSHTARLVVEADMNNLPLDEFIDALRNDPSRSACFKYIGFDKVVHHLDEDPSNDELSNLAVVDKANHDEHHAKEVGLGTVSTKVERITSIVAGAEEMTYDLIMKAPYHNYIANGFAVHNTGKGILMNRILKSLFGTNQVAIKRAAELSEKWTDFVQGKLMVCIDEVQTSAYNDEHSIISNLKNLITEPTATIRLMNRNAFEVPNYGNWIFNSNKPDPVTVDKEDRRFNVGPYQAGKLQITQQEIDAIEGELQTFYHYLENFKVDGDLAATPLANEARNTLIELSQTTSESTADAVREGRMAYLLDALPTGDSYKHDLKQVAKVDAFRRALCDILHRTKPDGTCNVRRDELHTIFEYTVGGMSQSPTTFTRFLGHKQIQIKPVSINGHAERGIQVTWQDVADFPNILATKFKDMAKSKV